MAKPKRVMYNYVSMSTLPKIRKIGENSSEVITTYSYPTEYKKNGIDYQVSTMDGEYPLGLLVLELQQGFFGKKKWKIKQTDAFCLDPEKAMEFDKRFEEKEKMYNYSQEIFKMNIRAFLR